MKAATLSIGQLAETACIMEVLAPKPGNVYPGASWNFSDLTVSDFLKSASAIRPVFDQSNQLGVGEVVLESVKATRTQVNTNTNLGQLLLLAPLAVALARHGRIVTSEVQEIIQQTSVKDSILVYEAIRLASPGGMGRRQDEDIYNIPTKPLWEVMRMARSDDAIAEEYAGGFQKVFHVGQSALMKAICAGETWRNAIVDCHISLLSLGDTLIRRKAGAEAERIVAQRARGVLQLKGNPFAFASELKSFDAFLRTSGNRLNPGTTADLVTAVVFVMLASGELKPPAHLHSIAEAEMNVQNHSRKTD